MSSEAAPPIRVRRALPEDAEVCGKVCFEAFASINQKHSFPPDIPSAGVAADFLGSMFSNPNFYCVVAEIDGQLAGSNCLDERSAIAGVGPITVMPNAQNRGVGRHLMQAVIDRARECSAPGVRLLQAAFHNRSLSLYTKLGFDAREPISIMQGEPFHVANENVTVRPALESDLASCNDICMRVHGHTRSGELRDSIDRGIARLVERNGRITGYTAGLGFFGHTVGETDLDLQALIGSGEEFHGPGILVPTRNAALFRWCLAHGLRVVYPMTLMSMGLYNEPAGAYRPSVSF